MTLRFTRRVSTLAINGLLVVLTLAAAAILVVQIVGRGDAPAAADESTPTPSADARRIPLNQVVGMTVGDLADRIDYDKRRREFQIIVVPFDATSTDRSRDGQRIVAVCADRDAVSRKTTVWLGIRDDDGLSARERRRVSARPGALTGDLRTRVTECRDSADAIAY
ncbi:hypothetical protein [Gordonia shandongensis]|uniref:hypothetical protein n=1 Tax=Gordonia shandongensis TaxID=376351 RepID=UPI0012EBDC94|nr:hypothetical protein [Gordonia shandongensis]